MKLGTMRTGPGIVEIVSAVSEILKSTVGMPKMHMCNIIAFQPVLVIQVSQDPRCQNALGQHLKGHP